MSNPMWSELNENYNKALSVINLQREEIGQLRTALVERQAVIDSLLDTLHSAPKGAWKEDAVFKSIQAGKANENLRAELAEANRRLLVVKEYFSAQVPFSSKLNMWDVFIKEIPEAADWLEERHNEVPR